MIESAEYLEDEEETSKSEIFVPIWKEVGKNAQNEFVHQFYLADVESFESPVTVIPDIGGLPNAYFLVKSKQEWREMFASWLGEPHNLDEIIPADEEMPNTAGEFDEEEEEDSDESDEESDSNEEDSDSDEEESDSEDED